MASQVSCEQKLLQTVQHDCVCLIYWTYNNTCQYKNMAHLFGMYCKEWKQPQESSSLTLPSVLEGKRPNWSTLGLWQKKSCIVCRQLAQYRMCVLQATAQPQHSHFYSVAEWQKMHTCKARISPLQLRPHFLYALFVIYLCTRHRHLFNKAYVIFGVLRGFIKYSLPQTSQQFLSHAAMSEAIKYHPE